MLHICSSKSRIAYSVLSTSQYSTEYSEPTSPVVATSLQHFSLHVMKQYPGWDARWTRTKFDAVAPAGHNPLALHSPDRRHRTIVADELARAAMFLVCLGFHLAVATLPKVQSAVSLSRHHIGAEPECVLRHGER